MGTVRLAKEFAIEIDDKTLLRCTDFSFSLGKNTVDITSFDSDGFEEYLADNKNWSITFGSMVQDGAADGSFNWLFDHWVHGDQDFPVKVKIGNLTGEHFEGEGILTDLSMDGSVGDKISSSGTIQGSGEIERKP